VLRELVHRRLGNLSSDASEVLSVAAVIGRVVEIEQLLRATTEALDESRIFDAIEELVRRQVFEDAGPGRVRFTHDKLREVGYGAIDPDELPHLHRRVAEILEAGNDDGVPADRPIPYAAIAHHYIRAGIPKRAVEALHHGSAEALSRSAYGAAAEGYEQLLTVGDFGDRRRAEWEHGLGEALLGLGDVTRGKERLVRSLELEGLPVADDSPHLAAGLVGELSRQMGHRVLPKTVIERPAERAQLLRSTRTYQRLVETYWFENDVWRMVFSALHALNFAEQAGPSEELARCYAIVGLAAGSIPMHPVAEHYARLASKTATAVGDPATEAYVLFISSVYRLGTGAFDRVEADLGRAADLSLRITDPRFHGESLTVLGLTALYRNDLDRADELFRSVGDAGRRYDNQQHRVWAAVGRSVVLYRRGRYAEAEALLGQAEELLSVGGPPLEYLRLHGLRGSIRLAAGDVAGAELSAARAETLMADMSVPTSHYLLEGFAGIANVRLALFDRRRRLSVTRAKRAVAALGRYASLFAIGRPRAFAAKAGLDLLEGRRRRGRRGFARAEEEARRLGMLHEIDHSRALAARLSR
jgi:hypothetical protein